MARYLVTGVGGFIGSNIAERLLDQGETVVGLDSFTTGKRDNLAVLKAHPNAQYFSFLEGDIRNVEDCQNAIKGVDYVLHQAALGSVPRSVENPMLYHDNNITGTLNMLEGARQSGVKRFVFASSSSVYGDTPVLPKVESMVPRPKSPYAVGKLAGEYYCKLYFDVYGLETIALRYFNVFGKRQDPNSMYAAVIPKFTTAYLNDTSPTIFGDGEQTRDFTFVENVVQANLACCTAQEAALGKAMNIGCGERISVNELSHKIRTIVGSTRDPIYEAPRAGDVRDSLADIGLFETYLKTASPVQLDEGLAATVAWYQDRHKG